MIRRLLLLLIVLAVPSLFAQNAPATLRVAGGARPPLNLTANDIAKMPRATVKASSHGVETEYEGVWLHELLKRAGVPQGEALRGKALASYVLAEAKDGYQVVFSLGELDPSFVDNRILVADSAGGKPLPSSQGPFRLVVPGDKAAARSVRMLTKLEVVLLRK